MHLVHSVEYSKRSQFRFNEVLYTQHNLQKIQTSKKIGKKFTQSFRLSVADIFKIVLHL